MSDEDKEDEEQFVSVIFIIRSSYNHFGGIIKDLLRDDIVNRVIISYLTIL